MQTPQAYGLRANPAPCGCSRTFQAHGVLELGRPAGREEPPGAQEDTGVGAPGRWVPQRPLTHPSEHMRPVLMASWSPGSRECGGAPDTGNGAGRRAGLAGERVRGGWGLTRAGVPAVAHTGSPGRRRRS